MALVSRTEQRHLYPVPVRIGLLENDADTVDADYKDVITKLDRLNARVTGFLVSTAVAAIMLAVNLMAGRH